ncbi:hypothetical protein GCM10023067_53030 [Aminobacter aganoensis]|uniref:hypothetical protein n=1 Tax=Aminobacter aganoensis TaxID=83264 RepID=UPI0031E77373
MKIAHIGTSFALIRRMTVIAQDIVCLELSPTRTDAFQPFTAGAHIDVFVNGDVIRQYSLSNDPADSSIYRLAIQKDPQSRGGSAAIHATFQAGTSSELAYLETTLSSLKTIPMWSWLLAA